MPRCPSGKRIYWKQRTAEKAVRVAADRGELGPMRVYECDECGKWHLASVRQRPSFRTKNGITFSEAQMTLMRRVGR